MAKRILLIYVLAIYTLSCDENDQTNIQSITDDEVVEVITQSLASDAYGLSAQIESSLVILEEQSSTNKLSCGNSMDTSFQVENSRDRFSYTYNVELNHKLECTNLTPSSYDLLAKLTGSSASQRISTESIATYEATIKNLTPNYEYFIFSGDLARTGTTTISTRNPKFYAGLLNVYSEEIKIDKQSRKIISGSAAYIWEVGDDSDNPTIHNGSISFLGNQKAQIRLNNNFYEISL